jgi:hypothetical protein
MADMRVREVDDALPGLLEILCVAVDSGDPSSAWCGGVMLSP